MTSETSPVIIDAWTAICTMRQHAYTDSLTGAIQPKHNHWKPDKHNHLGVRFFFVCIECVVDILEG